MTESDILAACTKHGAKRVYDAACARMSGDRGPLVAVGLQAESLGDANTIMTVAFGMMNTRQRAADLADAAIKAARI